MSDNTHHMLAHAILARRLCGLLIANGVISQQAGASVFLDAAQELRDGTEDGPLNRQANGETQAQVYEQMTHWLLGYKDVL